MYHIGYKKRHRLPCGSRKHNRSLRESRSSAAFSPSLCVLTEHPSAGFFPVSGSRSVVPEKELQWRRNFKSNFLPTVRVRAKSPSLLPKSKSKSKSYSSTGYSSSKRESGNLVSSPIEVTNSREDSPRGLIPEVLHRKKVHD